MAINISNRTFNSSLGKMIPRHSTSECIPWLVILITECLAIVILNLITIIVFVKKRQLQRRSTYLIIHLAIVDLLVGAVSGPLQIERRIARFCNLWGYNWNLNWSFHIKFAFLHLFSFTSFNNLVAISLERLHATFCPFRHRVANKWVYGVMIIVIWLTSTTREAVRVGMTGRYSWKVIDSILYLSIYFIFVFVICVSYILIVIKVRCSRRPQFHGATTKRERKLTGTCLIVALTSLLSLTPVIIYVFVLHSIRVNSIHIEMVVLTMFLSNSLINPVIYAMRMREFRAGISLLFCRALNRTKNPVNLPLQNLA